MSAQPVKTVTLTIWGKAAFLKIQFQSSFDEHCKNSAST